MPTITRKHLVVLAHKARSGLFLTAEGEYVADIKPDDGKRVIRRLGKDRERAKALFHALLAEIENAVWERQNPRLIDFLSTTFLHAQGHLKSYSYTVKRVNALVRFLEARYPTLRIADVRKPHSDALMDFYAHLSPRIRNGNLQKLKQALNLAVDFELLPANPLARCKGLRFDNRRIRTCDMEDFVALVQESRNLRTKDVPDILLVLGLTGLRPSNVFRLREDEVGEYTIQIPPEKMKNGRWGVIPVSRLAQRTLAERTPSNGWLFPSPRDASKPYQEIRSAWETLTKRTELEWLHVYDMRHFFASQLAKLGATEQQIGRLLCHVGTSVTSRYVHQEIEDLRPFVEKLGETFVEIRTSRDGI